VPRRQALEVRRQLGQLARAFIVLSRREASSSAFHIRAHNSVFFLDTFHEGGGCRCFFRTFACFSVDVGERRRLLPLLLLAAGRTARRRRGAAPLVDSTATTSLLRTRGLEFFSMYIITHALICRCLESGTTAKTTTKHRGPAKPRSPCWGRHPSSWWTGTLTSHLCNLAATVRQRSRHLSLVCLVWCECDNVDKMSVDCKDRSGESCTG
jgi:hypothetical protein